MIPIRHVACGTEVVAKRECVAPVDVPSRLALWCPTCKCYVRQDETDARGPLSVSFE